MAPREERFQVRFQIPKPGPGAFYSRCLFNSESCSPRKDMAPGFYSAGHTAAMVFHNGVQMRWNSPLVVPQDMQMGSKEVAPSGGLQPKSVAGPYVAADFYWLVEITTQFGMSSSAFDKSGAWFEAGARER